MRTVCIGAYRDVRVQRDEAESEFQKVFSIVPHEDETLRCTGVSRSLLLRIRSISRSLLTLPSSSTPSKAIPTVCQCQ
jgi:hypothetical protein